jgi:hypothetical protein
MIFIAKRVIISLFIYFVCIVTVEAQCVKINYPNKVYSHLDSICYGKEAMIFYSAFDTIFPFAREYRVFPVSGEKAYAIKKGNKTVYYDGDNFDLRDSVLVHGELWVRDYNKPFETYRGENDKKPIEADTYHYVYYYSPSQAALPTSEGFCRKGLKEGKWEVYYDSSRFSRIEEHYKQGIRDGLYTVYAKDSSILYQTEFKNGTGYEKIYTDTGDLYEEHWYLNGFVDKTKKRIYYYKEDNKTFILYDPENNIGEYYRKSDYPLFLRRFTKTYTGKNGESVDHLFKFEFRRDGTFKNMEHRSDSNTDYTIYGTQSGRIKKVRPWRFKNIYLHYRYKKLSKMGTEELNALEDKYYWLGKQK